MTRGKVRLLVLVPVLVALLLGGGLAAAARASALPLTGSEVTIDTGKLKGNVRLDRREFLGIPFAAPTSGDGRFRAPRPPARWSGVRDATKAGPACPQVLPSSEDCLTVDVHTPPLSAGIDLPVMVWIYGGAYVFGSNSGYDPSPLVRKGVIVVAVNYRLGPFGFLSLPGLEESNFGLLDQQAGLRWVKRNIAAFGGDPGRVTVFGESAGGNSVCHQMASPRAEGLFQQAIVQSGSCSGRNGLTPVSKDEIRERSRAFAREMGCDDTDEEVACLRALPQDKLLSSKSLEFRLDLTWVPNVDGVTVPRSLEDAWRTGSYQKVPMIVGGTRDEGRTFIALLDHLLTLSTVSPEEYADFVRDTFGDDAGAVLAKYPVSAFDSADLAKATVLTDFSFACATAFHIEQADAAGSRVFAYELNDVDPPFAGVDPFMPMGNFHGVDVLYLFNSLQGIPAIRNGTQQKLSDQMVAAWTSFARSGDPGAVGGSDWPAWSAERPRVIQLSSAGSRLSTAVPDDHNCDFWKPIVG
ncbi:carboxylesterase family protein [Micromonospora sp. CPCC 205371]|nr:carboxylesterase family protein [Micromonospora sp. CPCC 205371]